jgi:CheY-like chemotaxis protein
MPSGSARRRAIAAGFERHLVKPIHLDELERIIANPS